MYCIYVCIVCLRLEELNLRKQFLAKEMDKIRFRRRGQGREEW